MKDDNQKLLDEIITLSKLSNHRLREQTYKLIELYKEQKLKNDKQAKQHKEFLKQLDKRTLTLNARNSRQDILLRHQSRMAAMGEMMDAVAHQWKQPLNSLSMMSDMLSSDFENGLVDKEYIDEVTEMANMQIAHMVSTLSEFRNFFRPSKIAEDFCIDNCFESVQILMKDELVKNTVELNISVENKIVLHGQANEFKHLFLNLLSNSIDAFNEKDIKERKIQITAYIKDETVIIEFQDNAQGIPNHVINDIFKPNVTTKEDTKGTGIGLYMSSQIAQKHNGKIRVCNTEDGALFTITIKI
jgi:signal transduction histidine kinase